MFRLTGGKGVLLGSRIYVSSAPPGLVSTSFFWEESMSKQGDLYGALFSLLWPGLGQLA